MPGKRRRTAQSNRPSGSKREGRERDAQIVDSRIVEAVQNQGLQIDDFTTVGFSCAHCDFQTKKKGYSGRQSMRGHMKVHVRDKRAVWRPIARQLALLMLAAILGLAFHIFTPQSSL